MKGDTIRIEQKDAFIVEHDHFWSRYRFSKLIFRNGCCQVGGKVWTESIIRNRQMLTECLGKEIY